MSKADDSTNPPESRHRILSAAIVLFAERGFEGTSIRDITTAADCGVASVNYYFSGKDKLYEEAFRTLFTEIQERRMAAIRTSMAADPEMDLDAFLRSFSAAFLEPMIEGSRGAQFIAFMAREMSDQRMAPEVFVNEFIRPFMALSLEALSRYGPVMNDGDKMLSLMSVVGQLVHIVKVIHMSGMGELSLPVHSIDEYVDHVVRFSAAGIRACASDRPSAVGRREVKE